MSRPGASLVAVTIGAFLSVAASGGLAAVSGKWSYTGKTGPAKWAALDKTFAQCDEGQFQSPIDIPDATTRKGDFPSMLFNYKPSPLTVVDDGHTIEAEYAPGSFFSLDDKRYELLHIRFHKPGEHKINGRVHDMDAQLVHRGLDGKLVVLTVLLDAGKENRLMKTVADNLPREKGKEIAVDKATISAVDLLPDDKGYYRFDGSMTTPPCTEGVTWIVLKTPVQVSPDSVARFSRLYSMNARPVQPLNGRDIAATR